MHQNWATGCIGPVGEATVHVCTLHWTAKYSPTWGAYCALMACRLVALDKRPGVCPVGIGETLRQSQAKLVMRAAGDQAKTECGTLQLCAGLEVGIEGATHDVGQRQLNSVRVRRRAAEEKRTEEEEGGNGGMAYLLDNLRIETGGTDERAAEGLEAALEIQVVGDGKDDRAGEGEEEGTETLQALGALQLLTLDAEPSRITLVDACNGFNKLSRLAMLWTVRHRWPLGARFAFNCYMNWAQILLRQPGEPPATILGREGVTQGDPS